MSPRPYAFVLLFAAATAAVVSWNSLTSTLVAACTACLLVGFVWRRILPTLLAGVLLYPALALAMTAALPAAWSCLASGLFVIVVCERMTFEYEASEVLGSSTGVDAEARSLVSEVSRAHARKLALYVTLASLVIAGSALVSRFTVYASVLVAAAMLLMLAVLAYATR